MLRFLQCNDRIMKRWSSRPLSKKDRGSPLVSISENVLAKNKIISLGVGNLSGRKVSQLVQLSALLSGKVPVKHRCPQGLFVMGRYPHHFHTMSDKHGDIGPETGSISVPVAKSNPRRRRLTIASLSMSKRTGTAAECAASMACTKASRSAAAGV